MKLHIIILILIFPLVCNAQKVHFNGEAIDSIIFIGDNNFYRNSIRLTKGVTDSMILVYSDKTYLIKDFNRTDYEISYYVDKERSEKRSSNVMEEFIGVEYSLDIIQDLITEIENPIEAIDLIKQFDTIEIKKELSDTFMFDIAKEHNEQSCFDSTDFMFPYYGITFQEFRSMDTFNVFLIEKFGGKGYSKSWHYTNKIFVHIFTNSKCIILEGKYPNNLKQPWYIDEKGDRAYPDALLNLNINSKVAKVLPDGFVNKRSLDTGNLLRMYVEWYLDRRNIIFLEP